MTTTLIAIVAFIVLALVGWAVAEGKYKAVTYSADDAEQAALANYEKQLLARDGEMNIGDVIKTISTRGFSAV